MEFHSIWNQGGHRVHLKDMTTILVDELSKICKCLISNEWIDESNEPNLIDI